MMLWYDKEGNELTSVEEWAMLFTPLYQLVRQTTIGSYFVSTVWLGIDHNFTRIGPPIIFETMIFWRGEGEETDHMDMWMDRYSTEEQARLGHEDALNMVREFYKSINTVVNETEVAFTIPEV